MKFFQMLGKCRIPHRKNTADVAAVRMTAPSEVLLPTVQHIGAPSTVTVKVGERVFVGTKIAEAGGFVGAPIYSSVSGTVTKIESFLQSNGRTCDAVRIQSDGAMTPDEGIAPPVITDLDSLIAAVRASGLVGLGGAGFPTAVKLEAARSGAIRTVVFNGAECEPYITSDTRTMLERTEDIRYGVELLHKYIGADRFIFGIEENKPEAIEAMRTLFADLSFVEVAALPSTYPQGGEKILVYNTTGLVIPEGKLPADVGVLVMNVTTLAVLAQYAKTGMPLVEKCVTVDGSAVTDPKNVIAPIGTPISELLAFVGVTEEVGKILYGGPMMGIAVYTATDPVLKNTNAITVLDRRDAKLAEPTPCIHCGRCVEICPMGLNPTLYARALNVTSAEERAERLTDAKINLCIECGSCSFVCPAKRPLVQNNRLAKADLREYQSYKATLK